MLQDLITLAARSLDPAKAYETIEYLSGVHRIPTSNEHRQSVEWVAQQLRAAGLETEVHRYPTDGTLKAWGYVTPPHWQCRQGWLDFYGSNGTVRLADFASAPLSVIQRSASTSGVATAELCVVEGGSRPEDYPPSVRGKVIISDASAGDVLEYGIRQRGALGLISDAMAPIVPVRPNGDLEDCLQWTLFPYSRGRPLEGWGFVVSPSAGLEIRRECARAHDRGDAVQVRALLECETGSGFLDGVAAVLPGSSPEEIWMVAHLCHPAPFAHDNASGAALLLEIARTIGRLVRDGSIPPLRRGIRFLFPAEIAGTIAYLSANPHLAGHAAAGLNLDMVGARQDLTGSTLCIDRPPDACPSCLPELLEALYASTADHSKGLSGQSHYPMFRRTMTRFSGGSDHWALSDPSVGVPTPMLIEWPDRYYHTTGDRLENIDVAALSRNGTAAAAYALFLAGAGPEQADWLEKEAAGQFVSELGRLYGSRQGHQEAAIARSLRYRVDRQKECLRWLDRLRGPAPAENPPDRSAEARLERVAIALGAAPQGPTAAASELAAASEFALASELGDAAAWKLRRVYPGPISHFPYVGCLPYPAREAFRELCRLHPEAAGSLYRRLTHWMDGVNPLSKIADRLFEETGHRDDEFLVEYVKVVERMGLVIVDRCGPAEE